MNRKNFKSRLIWAEKTDSTNTLAKELIREKKVGHGSIIAANTQTAGRGYAGNSWESESGKNMTATWILQPEFLSPNLQFRLTKIISLAIRDLLSIYLGDSPPACIKWPNDVYAGNRKIAGVLIENSIMGDKIRDSICGIGLNINQQKFYSNAPNPVSLAMITGDIYQVEDLIGQLDQLIFQWYNRLQQEELALIDQSYLSAIYRLNQFSEYKKEGERFGGFIRGTDSLGRLIIEKMTGETEMFDFKEISMLI